MTTPIERLAKLSTQRTARTDRLEEATHALLAQLDKVTEVGDSATVDGVTLERVERRSNVGRNTFWRLSSGDHFDGGTACLLCEPVGCDRYMHGDFHCQLVGPARDELIQFAERAERFVAALIALRETEVLRLDAAVAAVVGCEVQS